MVSWRDIHEDFIRREYGKTYRQLWIAAGLTYQDAQKWIPAGFEPWDYEQVKQWKKLPFTPSQVQNLVSQGYQNDCYLLPTYFHGKGYQWTKVNWLDIQEDYLNWKEHLTIQDFLNIKYFTQEEKKQLKEILISYYSSKNEIPKEQSQLLEGNQLNLSAHPNLERVIIHGSFLKSKLTELNLSGCDKLVELDCSDNQLTNLNLSDGANLKKLNCSYNQLSSLEFLDSLSPEGLTKLYINSNKFPESDLTPFSRFINLEELHLNNNNFIGSLKPLAEMVKLKELDISDTGLDSGLEHLPESVKKFSCSSWRRDAKCKILDQELNKFGSSFPDNLKNLKRAWQDRQQIQLLQKQQSLFTEQEQEINYLELRVQELTNLIKQQKEKIINAFLRILPERELIQNLITTHLEFIRFKEKEANSPDYYDKCEEYEEQCLKIKKQLRKKLDKKTMNGVQRILDDCEKLVRDELELEERLQGKTFLIEEQRKFLQITDGSENEKNILEEHEATQQKQLQVAQQEINQLQKQLQAKTQQVSTVLEYQIAEKQEQLTNLMATLSLVSENQEKINLIQEEIKTLREELAKAERVEQQAQILHKPYGTPGSSKNN